MWQPGTLPLAARASRIVAGHPEGFHEGFANLYSDAAEAIAARRTGTLSGGQQQRTAIARALCQQANIILADEPIASLDPESSALVMDLLTAIARTEHATLLVSLHQLDVAIRSCERVIALRNGRICFDGPSSALNGDLLYSIYGGRWAEVLRRAEPSTPPGPSLVLPLP
jgi:phosphonate transport system ATP-binding protein